MASHAQVNFAGVNFSGDPAAAGNQRLESTESAGLVPQKFWNNAPGKSGQMGVEIDGGTSMSVFISGFTASWQGQAVGSSASGSLLPNSRLMRGSILSGPGSSILVQFAGIPISYTSAGYALLVYCDAPGNTTDVVIKAALQAGATVRTLYLRDRGSKDFSGVFSRGAFSTTEDSGTDTPAANVLIFTGLTATDLAVSIEPGESNPEATVAVNAVQLVPVNLLPAFAPRITSVLRASGKVGESFSYAAKTDLAASSIQAAGLPAGLTINPLTGEISGTPQVAGTFSVSLKAANSAGESTETLNLQIAAAGQTGLQIYLLPGVLVQGQLGETHIIEFTTSLGNSAMWQNCGVLTLTNSAQFYIDFSATNATRRFYRTRIQ